MNDVFAYLNEACSALLKISATISLLMLSRAVVAYLRKPRPGSLNRIIAAPAPVKAPSPQVVAALMEETVECGNCHNTIKSEAESRENGHSIYACETCGIRVQVPD